MLFRWWSKSPPPKLAEGYSIQGRKLSQQDAWYISPMLAANQLILVADGVGGHAHGDFASELCIEWFQKSFESLQGTISDVPNYLRHQALDIAKAIIEKGESNPEYKHCGTTLSGFFLKNNSFYTVNIGDSRVYQLDQNDQLIQLTRDHSVVQDLLDRGTITLEQARNHPQKHVMNSAIGQPVNQIQIDISGPYPIRSGEMLFVFSDGVHDPLTQDQIHGLILNNKKSPNLPKLLVEKAYELGGKDNITACFYRH